MKVRGRRVLSEHMGMRWARKVDNEKRRSWLIESGHLQGKWKDYITGKCSKRLRKENTQSRNGYY